MEKKRLNYLMLMYMAVFVLSVLLLSCDFGTKDKDGPGPEINPTETDSIFEKENIEIETTETDSLFDYGYPIEASQLNDTTYVYQGDILIDTRQKVQIFEPEDYDKRTPFQGVARTTGLWPNNLIYYQISPTIHNYARNDVMQAIKYLTENTNLRFEERAHSQGYVYFQNGNGCSSYMGRIGGRQIINLGSMRCGFGSTVHEIMHAAGFWHEQSRADRDKHVKVVWENIVPGMEHNFTMVSAYPSTPSANLTTDLDFNSIMMYSSLSFSRNGQPTLVKLDGSKFLANRSEPSEGDISSINKLYPAPVEPDPEEPEPEIPTVNYENGKYYTLQGLTVLRYDNRWFYLERTGWVGVELRERTDGTKAWFYIRTGEVPEDLKYKNGVKYVLYGLTVLRNYDRWYYFNGRSWIEVRLQTRADGSVYWITSKGTNINTKY